MLSAIRRQNQGQPQEDYHCQWCGAPLLTQHTPCKKGCGPHLNSVKELGVPNQKNSAEKSVPSGLSPAPHLQEDSLAGRRHRSLEQSPLLGQRAVQSVSHSVNWFGNALEFLIKVVFTLTMVILGSAGLIYGVWMVMESKFFEGFCALAISLILVSNAFILSRIQEVLHQREVDSHQNP